jgi:hypothetical protein
LSPVSQQQLFAEGEESRVGQAIVFKDDRFLHPLKHPLHSCHYPPTASHVLVRIVLQNLTVPVHAVNNGPRRRAFFRLARQAAPWAIGDHQQLSGLCASNASEDLFGYVRPVEDNENYWSAHRLMITASTGFTSMILLPRMRGILLGHYL